MLNVDETKNSCRIILILISKNDGETTYGDIRRGMRVRN